MADDLQERVIIERVELIARLTTEGGWRERDRELPLALIAEIAIDSALRNQKCSVVFSTIHTN